MVRTQIQLTDEQSKWLKETAAEQGVSIAEVIRQVLDKVRADRYKPSIDELRRRALAAAGSFRTSEDDVSERHDDYLAEAYSE